VPGIGDLEHTIATGTLFGAVLVCKASMFDGPKTHVVYHALPRDSAGSRCWTFVSNHSKYRYCRRQLLQDPYTLGIVDDGLHVRCLEMQDDLLPLPQFRERDPTEMYVVRQRVAAWTNCPTLPIYVHGVLLRLYLASSSASATHRGSWDGHRDILVGCAYNVIAKSLHKTLTYARSASLLDYHSLWPTLVSDMPPTST
jgi:hypothetical protein